MNKLSTNYYSSNKSNKFTPIVTSLPKELTQIDSVYLKKNISQVKYLVNSIDRFSNMLDHL